MWDFVFCDRRSSFILCLSYVDIICKRSSIYPTQENIHLFQSGELECICCSQLKWLSDGNPKNTTSSYSVLPSTTHVLGQKESGLESLLRDSCQCSEGILEVPLPWLCCIFLFYCYIWVPSSLVGYQLLSFKIVVVIAGSEIMANSFIVCSPAVFQDRCFSLCDDAQERMLGCQYLLPWGKKHSSGSDAFFVQMILGFGVISFADFALMIVYLADIKIFCLPHCPEVFSALLNLPNAVTH